MPCANSPAAASDHVFRAEHADLPGRHVDGFAGLQIDLAGIARTADPPGSRCRSSIVSVILANEPAGLMRTTRAGSCGVPSGSRRTSSSCGRT